MANSHKMNAGLQSYHLGQMMSNTKWGNGEVDIHAHMDRSLRLDENMKNIRAQFGVQTRNYGMEHLQQQREELVRNRARRAVPNRQTGQIQNSHNLAIDAMLHAMAPGKRVSASGHVYYERRANRSDVNYTQRL